MKKTRKFIGMALAFVMAFSVVCLTGCGEPYGDQWNEITHYYQDAGFIVDYLGINENGDKYDVEMSTPEDENADDFIVAFMEDGGKLFYECKYKNDEDKDAVINARTVKINGSEYKLKDDKVYRGAIKVYPPYVEEEMPENGKIFVNNFSSRPTFIEVKNPNEQAYVFKFKDKDGKEMISFFVAPKSNVKTYMGTGDYYMSFATGYKWYGEEDLFGGDTFYSKEEKPWEFVSSKYWTLDLTKDENGNVQGSYLDPDEF